MKNKVYSLEEALKNIHDGQTIMIGGFLQGGTPELLIDGILDKGIRDLTVISNDTAYPDTGIGKLVVDHRISHLIATHVGTNKETGRQMNAGEMKVTLVPQGTLAERIRSKAAGLGGFLTPTGVGTIVEEGKQKITVNGKDYLLEEPISADIALIKGFKADKYGNLTYKGVMRNFNPIMAMAADLVIAVVEEIVEVGEIAPEDVVTSGNFVDIIVKE